MRFWKVKNFGKALCKGLILQENYEYRVRTLPDSSRGLRPSSQLIFKLLVSSNPPRQFKGIKTQFCDLIHVSFLVRTLPDSSRGLRLSNCVNLSDSPVRTLPDSSRGLRLKTPIHPIPRCCSNPPRQFKGIKTLINLS